MDGLRVLHEATLILLERTGVRIESDIALDLLAAHGVRVGSSTRRIYPRAEHILATHQPPVLDPAIADEVRRMADQ